VALRKSRYVPDDSTLCLPGISTTWREQADATLQR
jgi:hypothetical protein